MILKGALLGLALFVGFMYFWFPHLVHNQFRIPRGTQYAISPSIIVWNAQFLSGLFLCLGLGLAVAGFWPKQN